MAHGRQSELQRTVDGLAAIPTAERRCQKGCDAICPPRKVYCQPCLDFELGSARAIEWGIRNEAERAVVRAR